MEPLDRNTLKPGADRWNDLVVALPDRHCFLPYYTSSPWGNDANGEFFIFLAANDDFSRLWLCSCRADSGKVTEHCELLSRRNAIDNYEEPLAMLWWNDERAIIMPHGCELVKTWIDTGREEVVFRYPNTAYYLRSAAQSPDCTRFAYGAFRSSMNEPPLDVELLIFDAKTVNVLFQMSFGRYNAGHFQFTGRENTILYCHEGNTLGIDDRLNLLDTVKKHKRILYHHTRHGETGALQECVGHEFATGTVIGAVRYPDSPGLPGGLLIVDLDGKAIFADADDYWHCAGNADGDVFVMDTMWWGNTRRKTPKRSDIIRIDFRAGTKQIIYSMETDPAKQFNHPHPQLTPDGNRVLFLQKPLDGYNQIHLLSRV